MTVRHLSRRSSGPGARRARLAATTLLAGLAALATITACGSGQYAQTANQNPGVPGVNINVGPDGTIQLRNIVVAYTGPVGYPVGASAPLVVRIFNSGPDQVTLTSVEAPGTAARVELTTSAPGAATTPPSTPSATATAGPSASPTATPSAGPAASASATAQPSATVGAAVPAPAAASSFPVPIASGAWALLVPGQGPYLVLSGLTKALAPGQNVDITFHFGDGTSVTIPVPMDLPSSPVRGSPVPGVEQPGE